METSDVFSEFNLIGILLMLAASLDIMRIITKHYLGTHSRKKGICYYLNLVLTLNILFNIANIIILSIFRLNHNGRVCSGDLRDEKSDDDDSYILIRGTFYLVLVFVHWIIIIVFILYLFVIPIFMGCCCC